MVFAEKKRRQNNNSADLRFACSVVGKKNKNLPNGVFFMVIYHLGWDPSPLSENGFMEPIYSAFWR